MTEAPALAENGSMHGAWRSWVLANLAAIVVCSVAAVATAVAALVVVSDESDDGWDALGNGILAGFGGVTVGIAAYLLVLALLLNRWIGGGVGLRAVGATIIGAVAGLAVGAGVASAVDGNALTVIVAAVGGIIVGQWLAVPLVSHTAAALSASGVVIVLVGAAVIA